MLSDSELQILFFDLKIESVFLSSNIAKPRLVPSNSQIEEWHRSLIKSNDN